ncbi:MAG: TldD/PmbA family protein [Kiloniellales bacterium]
MDDDQAQSLNLLEGLIRRARAAGADAVDAILVDGVSLAHAQRLGRLERLERAESRDLGLRVFVGRRQAVVSTTDLQPGMLDQLVERALAMVKTVPEDPYCGLAQPEALADTGNLPDLDGCDPVEPPTETLIERARRTEDAARAVDGVTNSEGAEASWSRSGVALVGSNGFAGAYTVTRHAIGVSVLAGTGTAMERDYEFSTTVHGKDLEAPEEVGRKAGERAVKRLGPRKAASMRVPVIYDPRVAGGVIRHLAAAINGAAIARGTSFLKDRMGERVFAAGVSVVDDPHRRRGLRSTPFDGEGVKNRRLDVIDHGQLTTWILDSRSARQLGLESTGHATRGTSAPPSPGASNLYLGPGEPTPEALIADIKAGFYVSELLGFGVNQVTGDYSRGAGGFWIEDGAIAYPVTELTIAGNLKDMFANLSAANDLEFRYAVNAPTLRIDGMTVAGR